MIFFLKKAGHLLKMKGALLFHLLEFHISANIKTFLSLSSHPACHGDPERCTFSCLFGYMHA